MAALLLAGQVQAQFVAFNDHVAGTIGTQTSANATTNDMRHNGGPFILKNILDGSTLPSVQMYVTVSGSPANGGSAASPTAGTPLATTFDGYCYFGANVIQVSAAQLITVTFTNLNPNNKYALRGGSVRGDTARSDRWTKCNLIGAASFTVAYQQSSTSPYGIIDTTKEPSVGLTGTEVAYNAGINLAGDMLGWTNITPNAGGGFSFTSTQWQYGSPVNTHGITGGTFTPNSTSYGYAIDAFRLEEYTGCQTFEAKMAETNITVTECSPLTLTCVVGCGVPPYYYSWYKGSTQIPGAPDAPVLTIPQAHPTDGATNTDEAYWCLVMDSTSGSPQVAISDYAYVTVISDSTPPTMLSPAIGTDLYSFTVSFSRPISFSGAGSFSVVPTNGGSGLSVSNAVLTNGTNVIITTTQPRGGQLYKVVANAGIETCSGLAVTPGSFALIQDQVALMAFTNHNWRYDESGTDRTADGWQSKTYDDGVTGWQTGMGAFDGSATPRTTVGTVHVGTVLLLTNTASSFAQNLPSYYFRAHVTMPDNFDPLQTAIRMRYMVDDGIVVYVNGTEVFRTDNLTSGVNDGFAQYCGGTAVGTASISTNVWLNPSFFNNGDNVVAVYLKQVNATSTDATADLELNAYITNYVQIGGSLIVIVPATESVAQCGTLHISALISQGYPPYALQWYHGATPISGATGVELTVPNVGTGDAGNYHLHVTDTFTPIPQETNSSNCVVTVTPVPVPTMVSAAAHPETNTITLIFSGSVNVAHANGSDFIIHPLSGGSDIVVTNVTPLTGTTFTLSAESAPGAANYELRVQGNGVSVCSGSVPSGSAIRIGIPVLMFGLDNTDWACNQSARDLGVAWLANDYNDQDASQGWTNGVSLFDGKNPIRPVGTIINGLTVRTELNLLSPDWGSGTNDIPTYYFKKHVTLAKQPPGFWIRIAWDDGGALFINGQMAYSNRFNAAFTNYTGMGAPSAEVAYQGPFFVPATNAIAGANVLGVEIKQTGATSSDIDMGMDMWQIVTNFVTGPRLTIVDNGTTVTISWAPAGGTLWSSSDLINWTQGTTANPQNITKSTTPPKYRFFRVVQ